MTSSATASAIAPARVLRYGLLGAPLAFAALPLHVQWPAFAAQHWGLPLAGLGLLLLAVRAADALVDPLLGRVADGAFARGGRLAGAATAATVAGVAALFLAPAPQGATVAWITAAALLALTSWAYSAAVVVHQAWAVRLGGDAHAQARWAGAREGCALAGVVAASVLPALLGWAATVALLAAAAALGWAALRTVPPGAAALPARTAAVAPGASPWRDSGFRALTTVQALNALAGALPATLVLFFVRDVLGADDRVAGLMLGLYFVAAALGVPLWVRLADRIGLVAAWGGGMALAIAAFAGTARLGAGDAPAFAAICVASGLALGADLVAAPALLSLRQREAAARADSGGAGLWFGWWALIAKLALALAAGLALPLVHALGYRPGAADPESVSALTLSYAALPCVFKALALGSLWALRERLAGGGPVPNPATAPRGALP